MATKKSPEPAPAPAAPAPSASGPRGTVVAGPSSQVTVDVAGVLDALAKQKKQRLNWRKSIVDLMKLLDLDSSATARKHLADELHYQGDKKDFGEDEHLAAQAGDDQACGEWREGSRRSKALEPQGAVLDGNFVAEIEVADETLETFSLAPTARAALAIGRPFPFGECLVQLNKGTGHPLQCGCPGGAGERDFGSPGSSSY